MFATRGKVDRLNEQLTTTVLLTYRIPLITGSILALTVFVNIFAFQIFSEEHFAEYISSVETGVMITPNPEQLQSFIHLSKLDKKTQQEYTEVIWELSNLSRSIENISKNPELYMSENGSGSSGTMLNIPYPNALTGTIDFTKLFLPFNLRSLGDDTPEGKFVGDILRDLLLVNLIWLSIILLIYFFWIRSIFFPIQSIIENLERIIGRKNYSNIAYTKNNEFQPLISTINNLHKSLSIQEKIRSDFLSDISHEIRTPITAVKCYLDGIEDGVLKLDTRTIWLLQSELARLTEITGQVMEYESMMRETYTTIDVERFSLKHVLEDLVASYLPQLQKNEQSISLHFGRESMIRMDRNMCIQIVHNIFSNFIKYAWMGSHLLCSFERTENSYILTFADDGIGIPDSEIDYVKEKFYRVDKGRNQEDKSMGIGLSIIDRIAHLHRGSLRVEKNHPSGVKFIVEMGR